MNVCNPRKATEAELKLNFQAFFTCLSGLGRVVRCTFRAHLHWKNPWEEDQRPVTNSVTYLPPWIPAVSHFYGLEAPLETENGILFTHLVSRPLSTYKRCVLPVYSLGDSE